MSSASTAAKQRWNKLHYSEIKASLKKDLVEQFKAKCKRDGDSIAGVLAALMSEYCAGTPNPKERKKEFPSDTRPRRRRTAAIIAGHIEELLLNETAYRENMPEGLQESIRAEASDYSIEKLGEALDAILDAF